MTELPCIQPLERAMRNGGVMTVEDRNDAWEILKANGSELTKERPPEESEDTLSSGPEY